MPKVSKNVALKTEEATIEEKKKDTSMKKVKEGVYEKRLKNGDTTFYITYRNNGKLYNQCIGKKSKGMDAQKAAAERANRIVASTYMVVANSKDTFASVYQQYLRERYQGAKKENVKTIVTSNSLFKHFAAVHNKKFCDISDDHIRDIIDRSYEKGNSDKTANDILAFFRRMYNYAFSTNRISCPDVSQKLRMKKLRGERVRTLNEKEIDLLIHYLREELKDEQLVLFVKLSLGTAARIGSLCTLKKMDIKKNSIRLYNHKSRKNYQLSLSNVYSADLRKRLAEIKDFQYVLNYHENEDLKRHLQRKLQPVFDLLFNTLEKLTIKKEKQHLLEGMKEKIIKNAAIRYASSAHKIVYKKASNGNIIAHTINMDRLTKVTGHTLRHTAATLLYQKTKDIYAVSKVLDHHSVNVTQRYAKYNMPDDLLDDLFKVYE
jgi:integrase